MGAVTILNQAPLYRRRRAVASAILAAGLTTLGVLVGWNIHETTDVRAKYIADIPVCKGVER